MGWVVSWLTGFTSFRNRYVFREENLYSTQLCYEIQTDSFSLLVTHLFFYPQKPTKT